jgi:hypothetical protein
MQTLNRLMTLRNFCLPRINKHMTKFDSLVADLHEANVPVQNGVAPQQGTNTNNSAAPVQPGNAANQQKPATGATTTAPTPPSTTQPVSNVNFTKDGFKKFTDDFNNPAAKLNSNNPTEATNALKQYGLNVTIK